MAATPSAQDATGDMRAIGLVVEQFRTAIIRKDVEGFSGLFFSADPQRVTWQFVADDARVQRLRQGAKPDAIKARDIPGVNDRGFIETVAAHPGPVEEAFSNVEIQSDGEVGAVAFDYVYLKDGQATNRGRELWQLVRTEAGWKIISVVWSIRDPESVRD